MISILAADSTTKPDPTTSIPSILGNYLWVVVYVCARASERNRNETTKTPMSRFSISNLWSAIFASFDCFSLSPACNTLTRLTRLVRLLMPSEILLNHKKINKNMNLNFECDELVCWKVRGEKGETKNWKKKLIITNSMGLSLNIRLDFQWISLAISSRDADYEN